jgi:hypothetical protein
MTEVIVRNTQGVAQEIDWRSFHATISSYPQLKHRSTFNWPDTAKVYVYLLGLRDDNFNSAFTVSIETTTS